MKMKCGLKQKLKDLSERYDGAAKFVKIYSNLSPTQLNETIKKDFSKKISDCFRSDISSNNNIRRLEKKKIKIFLNHKSSNLKNVSAVIYSSAIKKNNPEFVASKKLSIPLVNRADMLGELMRHKLSVAVAGSHGKTTTTSLIGSILEEGKKDPTIVIGGIINSMLNNNRLGLGKWMVVEADESDGSFLRLPHEINIITNIITNIPYPK